MSWSLKFPIVPSAWLLIISLVVEPPFKPSQYCRSWQASVTNYFWLGLLVLIIIRMTSLKQPLLVEYITLCIRTLSTLNIFASWVRGSWIFCQSIAAQAPFDRGLKNYWLPTRAVGGHFNENEHIDRFSWQENLTSEC